MTVSWATFVSATSAQSAVGPTRIAPAIRHVSTTAVPTLAAPLQCVAPMPSVLSATTGLSVLVQMASFPTPQLMSPVLGNPLLATSILIVHQVLCVP